MNITPPIASFFLACALLGPYAEAQDASFELVVTFDFLTDNPTPADSLAVQLGFDGGSYGVPVGSTLVQQTEVVGNDIFLSIEIEPPPTADVLSPAFFLLEPVVELGMFSPGKYEIHADVAGFTGQSSFVVVPEPTSAVMLALSSLCLVNARMRSQ